jgi:hypothetical protein
MKLLYSYLYNKNGFSSKTEDRKVNGGTGDKQNDGEGEGELAMIHSLMLFVNVTVYSQCNDNMILKKIPRQIQIYSAEIPPSPTTNLKEQGAERLYMEQLQVYKRKLQSRAGPHLQNDQSKMDGGVAQVVKLLLSSLKP